MPALTLAVLVTCTSALLIRLSAVVAVLFPGVGSGVVEVIDTRLVIEPPAPLTTTVSVIEPDAPAAKLAVVRLRLLPVTPKPTEPTLTLAVALTTVRFELTASVNVTLAAALGPALANVIT